VPLRAAAGRAVALSAGVGRWALLLRAEHGWLQRAAGCWGLPGDGRCWLPLCAGCQAQVAEALLPTPPAAALAAALAAAAAAAAAAAPLAAALGAPPAAAARGAAAPLAADLDAPPAAAAHPHAAAGPGCWVSARWACAGQLAA